MLQDMQAEVEQREKPASHATFDDNVRYTRYKMRNRQFTRVHEHHPLAFCGRISHDNLKTTDNQTTRLGAVHKW